MNLHSVFPPLNDSERLSARRFYRRLAVLYLLNLCDWLCTAALLFSGRFIEANQLMRPLLQSLPSTVLVKGLLPLGLILLCALIYRLAGLGECRAVNVMLLTGLVAYAALDLWHIFNFVLLFSGF